MRTTSTRNLDLFYGRNGPTSTGHLDQICRRFPLWRGSLRQECGEYLQFDPQRPDWWLEDVEEAINGEVTGSSTKDMEVCMEGEFLEYMKSWPDCNEGENEDSDMCLTSPPEMTSYYNHIRDGDLVFIEAALSPQEAFAVQSLGRCIRKLLPLKLPFYESRAFGNETDYLKSGNACTFLGGLLQTFVPGVEAQLISIATVARESARWGDEEGLSLPDPQTLGIRTTEHLLYQTTSQLAVHQDFESVYTVVISLSNPEDYQGGEFRLTSINPKFKPERLTAIVFRSNFTEHGIEPILSGRRETFATEFWESMDVPAGWNRPGLQYFEDYLKEKEYDTEL